MATTTNYSWTTPDDTALVKDGAAAIRTLGSSIDTTTKNLNPSTTLGDIEYRSSTANTNTRLGIGTTGQVLTVSGGVPSWATPGGTVLISTTTLSGSSISLTSIPSTYNDLKIVIRDFRPATDGAICTIRLNEDSNSVYTTIETFESAGSYTSTSSSGNLSSGSSDGTSDSFILAEIHDYFNTSTWKVVDFFGITNANGDPTNIKNRRGQIVYKSASAAVSSITLLPNSGNFTSGTVLLYGVK
jgi:hypothetical protein